MIGIVKINKQNYHKFDALVYWRIKEKERIEDVNVFIPDEIENKNLYVYAAECDQKFVGWISLVYVPKIGKINNKGYVYVDELWVEPNLRNKGIAILLMKQADDICKSLKTPEIRLFVNPENDSAYHLYKQLGFKKDSDAVYMRKSRASGE